MCCGYLYTFESSSIMSLAIWCSDSSYTVSGHGVSYKPCSTAILKLNLVNYTFP